MTRLEILRIIINWGIPFLCGGLITLSCTLFLRMKALRNGLQCLLRAEIIRQYEKWGETQKCPIYAKEALTKAYKAYHALGGNDVATEMYNKTMNLPTDSI